MCDKDKKIAQLESQLEIQTNINKLAAERDLMYWQGKNEKRKHNWFYPMLIGAFIASIPTIISAIAEAATKI